MGIKFPTPWKTLIIKFPPARDGKGVKCPGYARGGGRVVEASIDLYIMLNKDKFHNRQDLKQADVNIKNQNIL